MPPPIRHAHASTRSAALMLGLTAAARGRARDELVIAASIRNAGFTNCSPGNLQQRAQLRDRFPRWPSVSIADSMQGPSRDGERTRARRPALSRVRAWRRYSLLASAFSIARSHPPPILIDDRRRGSAQSSASPAQVAVHHEPPCSPADAIVLDTLRPSSSPRAPHLRFVVSAFARALRRRHARIDGGRRRRAGCIFIRQMRRALER